MSALKNAKRKVHKSEVVRRSACWLAAQYMRLVWKPRGAGKYVAATKVDALYDAGTPFIVSFWHGRLLMTPFGWQRAAPLSHADQRAPRRRADRTHGQAFGHRLDQRVDGERRQEIQRWGARALRTMLKALNRRRLCRCYAGRAARATYARVGRRHHRRPHVRRTDHPADLWGARRGGC